MVACHKEKHQEKKPPKYPKPKSQKRTPQLINKILSHMINEGWSLIKSCKYEGITGGAFIQWTYDDDNLAKQYATAANIRNEFLAEQLLDISDDAAEDDIFDANGNRLCNREWINRSRLRVDTRKWMLSKMLPKKYGDHLQVDTNANLNHSGGTVNVNISTDPVQASRDYQDFIKGKK